MTKKIVHCTPYLRNHTSYDCHFWYHCQVCFHFFKILILWVHREVKGQKTVQNNKKFYLPCPIPQESCIIWLSFMVQMCKIISPGAFFNYEVLIFRIVTGLKKQQTGQNDKYFCLSHLIFQEPYIIWSSFMVHMYVWKDNISRRFFRFFQNFDFQDH